jgi:hypothetical protein
MGCWSRELTLRRRGGGFCDVSMGSGSLEGILAWRLS